MTDDFRALINKYRARMAVVREAFERDGYLYAASGRDPSYAILLTSNTTSDAAWRVTSFRSGEPVGHREYDVLDGKGPTQNAYSEFASHDMVLGPRPRRAMRKRDRDRKIKEAEEAIEACQGAISRAPDDVARSIFERSQRIWQRQLDALTL